MLEQGFQSPALEPTVEGLQLEASMNANTLENQARHDFYQCGRRGHGIYNRGS